MDKLSKFLIIVLILLSSIIGLIIFLDYKNGNEFVSVTSKFFNNKKGNEFVSVTSKLKENSITLNNPSQLYNYLNKWQLQNNTTKPTLIYSASSLNITRQNLNYKKIIIVYENGWSSMGHITDPETKEVLISSSVYIDTNNNLIINLYPMDKLINKDKKNRNQILTDATLLTLQSVLKPITPDYTTEDYRTDLQSIIKDSLSSENPIFIFEK